MRLAPSLILAPLVAALALPVGAAAKPLDLLRGATLQSAAGTLTISESRCAPGSSDCGKVKLQERFTAGPKPRTRTGGGRQGFPAGLRISGTGTGECTADSPTTMVTGADGSQQLLSSATRLVPGKFAATHVAAAGNSRSIRIAWLEPLAPGVRCDYFDEPGTRLAVPAAQSLQRSLVSPPIPARVLKRARFSVTIAGSQQWNDQAADGTQIAGTATWRLRLVYRR